MIAAAIQHCGRDIVLSLSPGPAMVEQADHLPQTELLKDKGYEILYLTDDIDEFAVRVLHEFDGKEFRSVSGGDLGLEEEAEKKSLELPVLKQVLKEYRELAAEGKGNLGTQALYTYYAKKK